MSRELPRTIDQDEIQEAYPDAYLHHCTSCHEDLDYGFSEAIEPVVVAMPDGSHRTFFDSCCAFLSSLNESKIPSVDGWEYQVLNIDPEVKP